MVRKKVSENLASLTGHIMRESSVKMRSMEKEHMYGVMVKITMDNGVLIKCMDKDSYNGRTAGNTMAHLKMTRDKAMENLFGLMVAGIKENGIMANNMVLEFSKTMKKLLKKRVSGNTEREYNGYDYV